MIKEVVLCDECQAVHTEVSRQWFTIFFPHELSSDDPRFGIEIEPMLTPPTDVDLCSNEKHYCSVDHALRHIKRCLSILHDTTHVAEINKALYNTPETVEPLPEKETDET